MNYYSVLGKKRNDLNFKMDEGLNVEEGLAIVHLILANNKHRLEDGGLLWFFVNVALIQAFKALQHFVEGFMSSTSSAFELAHFRGVVGVWGHDFIDLTQMSLVTNAEVPSRNLVDKLFAENRNVGRTCF